MPVYPKLDGAVTGQLNGGDTRPALVEFFELLEATQAAGAGPFVPGKELGPEWDGQVFKAREWAEIGVVDLLVCDNLEGKRREPKGDYVKLQVVSGGEFSWFGDGDSQIEPSSSGVGDIGHHPHTDIVRDEQMLSEGVTLPPRKEGMIS